MGINDMEFQWRLNWWYRPTQLDGFETSVADYYDCFCDWKANMELNSCPANEADYVDAFIQNLRCDIRSRLPKYIFSGGLICAFLAAKLEESMMRIDEAFNKNDESLNLEGGTSIIDVLSAQIDSEKETYKVFDELPEQILGESPSIDQVLGSIGYDSAVADGTTFEDAGDVDKLLESKSNGGSDEKFVSNGGSDQAFAGSKTSTERSCSISTVEKVGLSSLNAGVQLMDKTKELFLSNLEVVEDVFQVFDEMPDMFSVKPNEELQGNNYSTTLIDYVPRVFDPGTTANGILDDQSKFDIGTENGAAKFPDGTISDFKDDDWNCKCCEVSTSLATEIFELNVDLCVGKVLLFTFDPGGNPLYHKGCSFLKPNSVVQNFDFRLNESNRARVDQCWTDLYSCHENDLVYFAFDEVEFISLNAGVRLMVKAEGLISLRHKLFIFDPGGSTSHHVECNAFRSNKCSVFQIVCKRDSEGFDIHTSAPTSYSSKHDNEIVSDWKAINCNSQLELVSLGVVVEVRIDCKWNPKIGIYMALGCTGRPMKYTSMAFSKNPTFYSCLEHLIMLGHHVNCIYRHMVILSWCSFIGGTGQEQIEGAEIWCCRGYAQHCVRRYLLVMVMLRIDFSFNHCCVDHFFLILVNNLIWRPCHGKTVKYITRLGKHMFIDDGMKPTEQPLQDLLGQHKATGYFPWRFQTSLGRIEFALGNEKHHCQSVDNYALSTQVYEIANYGDLVMTAEYRLGMEKGSLELYVPVKGIFYVWMFSGSCHFHEGIFPGGHNNIVLLMVILLESFVWDPGLSAQFFFPVSHVQLVPFWWALCSFTSLGTRMVLREREEDGMYMQR